MTYIHRIFVPILLVMFICACGTSVLRWSQDTYIVRQGDTLYGIAFAHGLDHRKLARWNKLQLNQPIYPGDKLMLTAPSGIESKSIRETKPKPSVKNGNSRKPKPKSPPKTHPAPVWRWPTKGVLVAKFGDQNAAGKGLDIRGREGIPIVAAAPGKVMYAGSGLIGYGKLIIIKHNESYLSAYGYNRRLLAKQGDTVTTGQQIAEMGVGPGKQSILHFEIRVNGKAVDPLRYLPPL